MQQVWHQSPLIRFVTQVIVSLIVVTTTFMILFSWAWTLAISVAVLTLILPIAYIYFIYYHGLFLIQQGKLIESIQHYQRIASLTIPPHQARMYLRLGELRQVAGDVDGAIEAFSKAIQLVGENPMLYAVRASLYMSARNYEKAIQDTNRLLVLAPDSGFGYANRASAHLAMGKIEDAIEDCQRGLRHDITGTTRSMLYNNLGTAYRMQADYHEAMANYNMAMASRLEPNEKAAIHPVILTNQGIVYHLQQDYDQARAYYQQATSLNPGNPRSWVGLALARFKLNQLSEAHSLWQDITRAEPRYQSAAFVHRDLDLPDAMKPDIAALIDSIDNQDN